MAASNQYHCRVGVLSRANGRCATQFVAYIARDELRDERLDQTYDSRAKEDLLARGFEVPDRCPAEYRELRDRMKVQMPDGSVKEHEWDDRIGIRVTHDFYGRFANDVEASSARRDAQLLRVSDVALPKELYDESDGKCPERDMIAVGESIARAGAAEGKVVVWALHGPHDNGDGTDNGNWHLHFAESVRPIDEDGFHAKSVALYHVRDLSGADRWMSSGELARARAADEAEGKAAEREGRDPEVHGWEKVYRYDGERLTKPEVESRGLDPVADRDSKTPEMKRGNLVDWDSKEALLRYRETVERCVREQLEKRGLDVEYDRRSYAERGIDREPQVHLGHAATEMAREGKSSDLFEANEAVKERNAAREAAEEREREAAPRDAVEGRVAALGGDLSEYRALSGPARDYVSAALGYSENLDRLEALEGSVDDETGDYRTDADRQEAGFLRSSTRSWRSGEIADPERDDAWKFYQKIQSPDERAWVSSLLADEPGHSHVAAREAMDAFARADRTGDPDDDRRARDAFASMPYQSQTAVWREIAIGGAPGEESFERTGTERDMEDKMETMQDIDLSRRAGQREYDELSRAGAGLGDGFAQLAASMARAAAQGRQAGHGRHRRERGRDDSHIEYQRTVR